MSVAAAEPSSSWAQPIQLATPEGGCRGFRSITPRVVLQIAHSAILGMSHVGRLVCFGRYLELPTPAAAQPRGSWSSVCVRSNTRSVPQRGARTHHPRSHGRLCDRSPT
eukprot:775271-Prymnesium_polylepis.1